MTRDGTPTGGEYRLTGLAVSTSYDRPSIRSVLEPSAFYSAAAVEREADRTGEEQAVVDVSDVESDAVREAVEAAIRSGEWRSNTLPDGLAETVERVDFFPGPTNDDTHTHVGLTLRRLHPGRPPAVEFGARIVDDEVSSGSPGAIELGLVNVGSTPQEVFSGTVPPFGTVFAEPVDGDDRFLLWREYEDEGCITFDDEGWMRCDIGTITNLAPCERANRRYEVLPTSTTHYPDFTVPPGPGTYRIADSVTYSQGNGAPESTLSFEEELTLERP